MIDIKRLMDNPVLPFLGFILGGFAIIAIASLGAMAIVYGIGETIDAIANYQ